MVLKYDIMIALADITLLLFETNLSKKILKATNTFADMSFSPHPPYSFLTYRISAFLKGVVEK